MGTNCKLHFYVEPFRDHETIVQRVRAEIERIERRFSRFRHDSDLARINRTAKEGGTILVDEEMALMLDYAFEAYRKSDGLFDISSGLLRSIWDFQSKVLPSQSAIQSLLPYVGLDKVKWVSPKLTFEFAGMELDFGGLAKEYAVDRVAELLLAEEVRHATIDLGGDIRIVGPLPDGSPWQIAIQHPRSPKERMETCHISRGALATSGDYERSFVVDGVTYSHILNPKTGWPVRGLSSVSVLADRCLVAGTVCTTAMLMGSEGTSWLRKLGLKCIWMDCDGNSEGWI